MPNNDILFFSDVKEQIDKSAGKDRTLGYNQFFDLAAIKNAAPEQLLALSEVSDEPLKSKLQNYVATLSTGPKSLEAPDQALNIPGSEKGISRSYSSSHFRSSENYDNNKAA